MTDLDTSAYTPAHEVENNEQQQDDEERERTRYEIPLNQSKDNRFKKHLQKMLEMARENTEIRENLLHILNLLEQYDDKKFLKMYVYKCDKCGETFDTKQGIGVHHQTNPNCNGEDRPWNTEEPTYTPKRVEEITE